MGQVCILVRAGDRIGRQAPFAGSCAALLAIGHRRIIALSTVTLDNSVHEMAEHISSLAASSSFSDHLIWRCRIEWLPQLDSLNARSSSRMAIPSRFIAVARAAQYLVIASPAPAVPLGIGHGFSFSLLLSSSSRRFALPIWRLRLEPWSAA